MTPKTVGQADPIGQSLSLRMKRGNVQTVITDNRSSGAVKKPLVFRLK